MQGSAALQLRTRSLMTDCYAHAQGLQPSTLFDDSFELDYEDQSTALGSTEVLYTRRGSQGQGVSSHVTSKFGLDPSRLHDLFLMSVTGLGKNNFYWEQRPLFTFKKQPDWLDPIAPGGTWDCLAQISVPMMA